MQTYMYSTKERQAIEGGGGAQHAHNHDHMIVPQVGGLAADLGAGSLDQLALGPDHPDQLSRRQAGKLPAGPAGLEAVHRRGWRRRRLLLLMARARCFCPEQQ